MLYEVYFPRLGLNESTANSKQPALTTRDAQNVRNMQSLTRALRGSSRCGLRKHTQNVLEAAAKKVAHLGKVMFDNKHVSYANLSPTVADIAWSRETPAKTDGRALANDSQGNLYVTNANASVAKFNRDGVLLWTQSLPVKDRAAVCRALIVDALDRVYVGVSAGGDVEDARVWCLKQGGAQTVSIAWELAPGAFVEAFALFGSRLYTVQNQPDRFEANVVVYDKVLTSAPKESKRIRTAYPCNDIDVGPDGSIFTASPPFADRGKDPRFPGFTQRTVDWRIERDLVDYDKRVWCHLEGEDLIAEVLGEDDPVEFFPDRSGNDRHVYRDPNALAPTFNLRGIAGQPTVRFDGANTGGGAALTSFPNQSIAAASADQQKTIVPAYVGARWVMFILLRVPAEDAVIRPAFAWDNAGAGAHADEKQLLFNRTSNATAIGGPSQGFLTWLEAATAGQPGAGVGGHPIQTAFNQIYTSATTTATTGLGSGLTGSQNNCVLIAIGCDGGNAAAEPAFHSFLRVNGKPMDRWVSAAPSTGLEVARLGLSFTAALADLLQGEIAELLVLRDYPAISPAADAVLTHPKYPRTIGAIGVSAVNAWAPGGDSELERIEGAMMHKRGCSHLLPAGIVYTAPAGGANPNYATFAPSLTPPAAVVNIGHYPHPFYQPFGPPRVGGVAVESQPWLLHSTAGVLAKFTPAGECQWVLTNRAAVTWSSGTFPLVELGGIGYGVRVNSLGEVYSTGPIFDTTPGTKAAVLRKVIDKGTTYSVAGADGAWFKQLSDFDGAAALSSLDDQYVKMAVDTFDNVFLPILELNSTLTATLVAFTRTGTSLFNLGGSLNHFEAAAGAACPQGLAVVVDPRVPSYQTGGPARAQYFYVVTDRGRVGGGGPIAGTPVLYKVPTVTVSSVSGSARNLQTFGITDGKLRKFSVTRDGAGNITASSQTSPAGAGTLAQPEFDPVADFYDSVELFGKAFIVDGKFNRVFDPVADTVTAWLSRTGGTVPENRRLITSFRARVVLGGGPDDRHNLDMSAVENPFDFDVRPGIITPKQAVRLSASPGAGLCPDAITALISFGDDVLATGCDHSIFQMTGDPLAGGDWDDVSKTIGMPFGRPHARDEKDILHFVGNNGGIYRWRFGQVPEPVSDEAIQARLQRINFDTHFIECVWDTAEDGMHIFQTPRAHSAFTLVDAWFWERRTGTLIEGAVWQDRFGRAAAHGWQPTSLLLVDGDKPDDRRVIVGCEDGYVREFDRAQRNDDGQPIDSYVLIGPIIPDQQAIEWKFSGLELVLASNQGGVHWQFFATDTPDALGIPVASGSLNAGRNVQARFRARGAYGFLKLQSANRNSSWALESIHVDASPSGRRRKRS